MENKPYSLQAPEGIAKEYGGNKQKIAAAVQSGLVDPTAALMAGMFIDRMRSAQSLEAAPTQTLAQQVFAPPAPPPMPGASGLAGIAPPPPQQPAPPQQPMPQQPPGMASGGLMMLNNPAFNEDSFAGGGVVAFADGGFFDRARTRDFTGRNKELTEEELIALKEKIRKGRKDTQKGKNALANLGDILNTSYEGPRGLDLVASMFKGQPDEIPVEPNMVSPVMPVAKPPQFKVAEEERLKYSKGPYTLPNGQEGAGLEAIIPAQVSARASSGTQRGLPSTGSGRRSAASVSQTSPITPDQTKDQLMAEYLSKVGAAPEMEAMSKEDIAARKNEDLWTTLAQIGFGTAAGTSQFALENLGKGAAGAMPGMQKALENRRSDEKEARRDRFQNELAKFGVKGDAYKSAVQQFEKMSDREQQLKIQEMQDATQRRGQDINREVGMAQVNRATGSERLVDMIATGSRPDATDEQKRRGKAAEFALGKFGGEDRGAGIMDKAYDNVLTRLEKDRSISLEMEALRRADKKNKTNTADVLFRRLLTEEAARLRSGTLAGPMNPAGRSGMPSLPPGFEVDS